MIYGLDENITFPYTNYYKKYSKKTLGFYVDPRGQKEVDLTRRINIIVRSTVYKLKTIDYMKKQFDKIDKDLYPIDESTLYAFGNKVMELRELWKSESLEDSFYDARLEIVDEIQKLREQVDTLYTKALEDRKIIGQEVIDNCLHGQRIKLMKMDMCLPIFEGYREFVYRFYPGSKVKKQFSLENTTRLGFSEKLISIVELLKNIKHQDDEVFLNLSEEAQSYYEKWYVYFNRPDNDSLEVKQEYLEAITIIERVIKEEIKKYEQYLLDAQEEKQRILADAESEKQKELQAQLQNEKRAQEFAKEEEERKQVHNDDLQKQLILIDKSLDTQFQEAKKTLEAQHQQEINELLVQYPVVSTSQNEIALTSVQSLNGVNQQNSNLYTTQKNEVQRKSNKSNSQPDFFIILYKGIQSIAKDGL